MIFADTPHLRSSVGQLLAAAPLRIQSLTLPDGQRFWMKRVEKLPLRLWLQKGSPTAAFAAELLGLSVLGDRGLPVAPIALEGPGFVVMPDVGRTLQAMLVDASVPLRDITLAFGRAGRSLAQLHLAGFVHGRPAIRDICWDGDEARFIDLERFSLSRRGARSQALDIVMFVQTLMTARSAAAGRVDAACNAAMAAFVADAPPETLRAIRRISGLLCLAGPLVRGLARLRPGSRELRAVAPTLDRLRHLGR